MEPIFEFSLNFTRWLQTTYPQLKGFFEIISSLGTEEFYLAFIPLIYWCVNKQMGKYLGYLFLFSNALNATAKHGFRGPRPYWLDDSVQMVEETSYGVPSGHAQAATVTYLFLAMWMRQRWMWLVAVFMVVAMGLSRIYLGVHFVHDVVVGSFLALLLVLGFFWGWQRYAAKSFERRILGYRVLITLLVPFLLGLMYAGVRLLIGLPDESVAWAVHIEAAEREGIEGVTTAVASVLGIGIGITLEGSRVRFLVAGAVWKKVARYVIGMAVAVGIWAGLKAVFPEDPLWVAIPLRFLRYTLLTVWVGLYAPMSFVRLGLADAQPEPALDLKLSA